MQATQTHSAGSSFLVTGASAVAMLIFLGLRSFYATFLVQKKIYFKHLSVTHSNVGLLHDYFRSTQYKNVSIRKQLLKFL